MWLGSPTASCLRSHDEPLQDYSHDSLHVRKRRAERKLLQVPLFHASETSDISTDGRSTGKSCHDSDTETKKTPLPADSAQGCNNFVDYLHSLQIDYVLCFIHVRLNLKNFITKVISATIKLLQHKNTEVCRWKKAGPWQHTQLFYYMPWISRSAVVEFQISR